jgi:LysR family hydrogen peroxide-inducible transcriptional activator
MNLSDLRYLVAVADHRHFGRAAEACFVSQPTLSTQLKKLEGELGVQLIERNPRHVMLTAAGSRVVEHARRALEEADAIRDVARLAADPESGSLRLGLFPTLGPYLLPHVVPSLRARFPNLELLLVEEKTDVVLQRLQEGKLDVALLALPIEGEHLHCEALFDEDFVLAVPSTHPLATRRRRIDLSVLQGEQLLLLEEGHCLRAQALSVCQLNGGGERAGFRATSLETLRQMVAAGVGSTLLPELAVHEPVPAYDGLALLRFTAPAPSRRIAMVWRTSSGLGEFLPKVAEALRDAVRGLPVTVIGAPVSTDQGAAPATRRSRRPAATS